MRVSSLFTYAPLDHDSSINESRCGGCTLCVKNCPAQALKGTLWKAGMEREEIVDVETCYRKEKEIMTKATGIETDLCGKCFAVCAYTDRYLKRASEEDAMCTLVKPDERYTAQIEAFKQEMLEAGSSMDGTGSLRQNDPLEWIKENRLYEKKENVPENWVSATQYAYVRQQDQKILGMIQIRHYFNGYLEKYGGHIGYSVCPSERRKGYAKRMLKEALPLCRELGLKKVLITCLKKMQGAKRQSLQMAGFMSPQNPRMERRSLPDFLFLRIGEEIR